MNKDLLSQLEKEGTPAYVFDLDVFRNRFAYLHNGIGLDTGMTFSMKANPFLTSTAAKIAEHIEVCSFGEFCLCRYLGIRPEKLLISGVLKKEEDAREMAGYGKDAALYTAESPDQMEILNACGKALGLTLEVLPRLSSGSQFGMDAETVKGLIAHRDQYPYLHIRGIHFFSGTQKKMLKKHTKKLRCLMPSCSRLKQKQDIICRCWNMAPVLACRTLWIRRKLSQHRKVWLNLRLCLPA